MLQQYPTHSQLMNWVAAALPTKWRFVGIQLGVSVPRLDEIEVNYPQDCRRRYSAMFWLWENQKLPPFTWTSVIEALKSSLVEENTVAASIEEALKESSQSQM